MVHIHPVTKATLGAFGCWDQGSSFMHSPPSPPPPPEEERETEIHAVFGLRPEDIGAVHSLYVFCLSGLCMEINFTAHYVYRVSKGKICSELKMHKRTKTPVQETRQRASWHLWGNLGSKPGPSSTSFSLEPRSLKSGSLIIVLCVMLCTCSWHILVI